MSPSGLFKSLTTLLLCRTSFYTRLQPKIRTYSSTIVHGR